MSSCRASLRSVVLLLTLAACGGGSGEPTQPQGPPPAPRATQLAFVTAPSDAAAQVAIAPAPVVEIRDASGARVAGSTLVITIALTGGAPGAALLGTLTQSAVDGRATFTGLSVDAAGSGYTLTASAVGVASATSPAFAIAAPPRALGIVSGNTQTGAPGAALAQPLRVRVTRVSDGSPVAGETVGFAPAGGGSVSAATVVTGADGTAQTTWTLGSSGAQTVSATLTGAPSVTFSATFAAVDVGLTLSQVSGGNFFFCGIQTSGGAVCWGTGNRGQLGNGPTVNPGATRSRPVPVSGAALVRVATGANTACGLTASGTGRCWGGNENGQLGNGTGADAFAPVDIAGGRTWADIAVGGEHACGLTTTGAAFCWGGNERGELGTGTGRTNAPDALVPVAVTGGRTYSRITAGFLFTCALDTTGQAWCWGTNGSGQLGDGTTTLRNAPVQVQQPTGVTFVSLASGPVSTCARTAAGAVYCWGDNGSGQLGDGTTVPRSVPTPVQTTAAFSAVSGGGTRHVCAVRASDQSAQCWGSNTTGALGDGTQTSQSAPTTQVSGGRRWAQLAGSNPASCGIEAQTNRAFCWGSRSSGILGDGGTGSTVQSQPVAVLSVLP
jgi:alpha-tubulin suppressor-like RCC1 family protein